MYTHNEPILKGWKVNLINVVGIPSIILLLNVIAAIITVFKEPRDITATWAWLLVLNLLPVIGFGIYLLVGKKISKEKMFDLKMQKRLGLDQLVELQKEQWKEEELLPEGLRTHEVRQTVHLLLETDHAILTKNNQVDVYIDGHDKFAQLITDIEHAKHHVHLEYYSFFSDRIGHKILKSLEDAAKRGVKVRIIYDSMGSRGQARDFFNKLEALGGEAQPFFAYKKALIHSPRINYREHRKLAIIDGKIGYIGGFNIGDQYLSRTEKFGYWRDTHLRVVGNAVISMQSRFLMDWNATIKNVKGKEPVKYSETYFPLQRQKGNIGIQIVSSGPDSEVEAIKKGYLKLISRANDYIYIQTPYLIPDDSVLEALVVAAKSGVDVKIMIPCMPDHAFVYRATEYYAKYLVSKGVEVYKYDAGFIHAKTFVVDSQLSSVGSANVDFRSFKLNFEANAFCYDRTLAKKLKGLFEADLDKCTKLTPEYFDKQSSWRKFKQYFSRLLSPIL